MAIKNKDNNQTVKWINAFYNPYTFWRSPIKWTKCFFHSFSIARDRIVRGWSPYDVWDLNTYVNQILGQGLDYLADNHNGYPGVKPFETSEKWSEWLHAQAKAFNDLNRDNDEENPYAPRYLKYLEEAHFESRPSKNHPGLYELEMRNSCPKDLEEKYRAMDEVIEKRKATNLRLAMKELSEYWGSLWD